MSVLQHKILQALAAKVRDNAKVPKKVDELPTIQDNNQAITRGAINEKAIAGDLRSEGQPKKRGRPRKSVR